MLEEILAQAKQTLVDAKFQLEVALEVGDVEAVSSLIECAEDCSAAINDLKSVISRRKI